MSFPIVIDANGSSQPGGTIPSGGVFFYGTVAYVFAAHGSPSQLTAYSSPDGITWNSIDTAHRPAMYSNTGLFNVVQDTNLKNLFYLVFPGTGDVWYVTTFDAAAGAAGQWTGTVYALSNPSQGGPAEVINLWYLCFRSTDSRVLFSVMGDNTLAGGSTFLAQICVIDPATGMQSAWVTAPYEVPIDGGSNWETAVIGMAEGGAGGIHIIINRPTTVGDGSDFTRTFQTVLDTGGGFAPLVEILQLQSAEQGGLAVVLIDDLKSDGQTVYLARADPHSNYSADTGELIVGGGASTPAGVAFSFELITPNAGLPLAAGLAIVPAGINLDFGLIFTDGNGLDFWEAVGPGAFVLFSTDTPHFESAVAPIGTVGFGASSVLGASTAGALGIRANGPVFRLVQLSKRKMFPRYIKRFNQVGN